MENNNKIFCGNGKSCGQYGGVAISVCLSDIPASHITTANNGKKYVTIFVNPNKNGVDQYGKTHNLTLPNNNQGNAQNQQQSAPQGNQSANFGNNNAVNQQGGFSNQSNGGFNSINTDFDVSSFDKPNSDGVPF